jgi:DNA-binding GntR family transcriptional regulator
VRCAGAPPARTVAARIACGELARGARLPAERDLAERDLAERWGIAYQTVRRTMRELRERGLVVSVPGKGTFIVSWAAGEPACRPGLDPIPLT